MAEIELMQIFSEFSAELNGSIARELAEIGDEAVQELRETSPKDTGEYSRSWVSTVTKTAFGSSVTICNRKYQLTHLLENGTANADGTQRTKAKRHISTANDNAQKKALKALGGDENGA